MKVVILAGGLGTRLAEETGVRPKPMVEIGGKPILWHIMKIYEHHGFNDFVICLGYKGHLIKEYFINYFLYNSDITVEVNSNKLSVHYTSSETFKVTLVDTGITTNTAGRIKKIKPYLNEGETFMLTYGDGVSDININELIHFHKTHKKIATLTSIQLPGRYGAIQIGDNDVVTHFQEKKDTENIWVNGGFFVLEPSVFDYLHGDMDEVQWEKKPLEAITNDGQLTSYRHAGFWKSMDALRDKIELEDLWQSGNAPWKIWK
jgi:glucose-1-phosphate cytidylyltransferase